ncbi:conserved hypothetical protein [Histoplasma capsulatum H143]|uniref:Uncharacterized protein n=1 Tax=Ajellomyces capsulatus (strain H143) TaxID=544712 RepID=C6HIX3_AJECH|nr:conserved hypothetical protein [Histoplasma capsulatum H143]
MPFIAAHHLFRGRKRYQSFLKGAPPRRATYQRVYILAMTTKTHTVAFGAGTAFDFLDSSPV